MHKEGGTMKRIQGKNIVGYMTIYVKGKNPEAFFQMCAAANIPVWDIKKQKKTACSGHIYLHHFKKVKAIAQNSHYDVKIKDQKGSIIQLMKLWKRKEVILSIILCSVIIFFLSNIIWKVEIEGVSTDVEKKLNNTLRAVGLYEGGWIFSLDTLDIVQQQVLNDVPELLYIGIEKKGTTYTVDAVEKLEVKEENPLPNQHLVATKNGIIEKMFIKKGSPTVNINDYVKQGDLLVSGVIEDEETDDKEEDEEDKENGTDGKITSAEGKVYANTWYEVTVTSSLYHYEEKLSGDNMNKYSLHLFNKEIPIWGFKKVPFEHTFEEKEKKPIYLLKWKIPLSITKKTIYDKESFTQIRSEEEAKEIAIEQVKNDLHIKLGSDVEILKYYVLHESVDNGKVKLNLYVSVLENIAKGKPIQ